MVVEESGRGRGEDGDKGMRYPKIDTLWKRDENNKYCIIEDDYSRPEFTNIKTWLFTEKVDGTNIRVSWKNEVDDLGRSWVIGGLGKVEFDGRGDESQIPIKLLEMLTEKFTAECFKSAFVKEGDGNKAPRNVILFGEGYGPNIHSGGLYRNDPGFILFDVNIDGWWLDRGNVEDIAKKMDIPVVPIKGIGSIDLGVGLVKSAPNSLISKQPRVAEGIVARSYPLVLLRDGTPLMWKLKVKDYKDLEKNKK